MADASSPAPELRVVDGDASAHANTLVLDRRNPRETARRFLDMHYECDLGRTLLFDAELGCFQQWTGSAYERRDVGDVREEVAAFLEEAMVERSKAGVPPSYAPFKPVAKDVAEVMGALESQIYHSAGAPAWTPPDVELPPACEMIAFRNGLLHLPSKAWCSADSRFFCRSALPFHYTEAPTMGMGRWLGFLDDLWADDQESINTLQEIFGLCLTRRTSLQKAFLVVGPPRSGKGTLLSILRSLVGEDNVATPTLGDFARPFGLAPLIGRSLAVISDARLSGRTDQAAVVERILNITGEDKVTIDRKHRAPLETKLGTRFIIATNELPAFKDASGAFASRFVILSLSRSFLGCEDRNLFAELLEELPAIFHWAVEGLERLENRGRFIQPASGASLLDDLQDIGSPVKAFVRNCCELDPEAAVPKAEVIDCYFRWCDAHGHRRMNDNMLARDLAALGIDGFKTTKRRLGGRPIPHFVGMRLAS